MAEPIRLIYKCEVITPMFIGGALETDCEINSKTFRNLLELWWRATNSHIDTKHLYKNYSYIFGSGGEHSNKSKVGVSLKNIKIYSNNSNDQIKRFQTEFVNDVKTYDGVNFKKKRKVNIISYLTYGVSNLKLLEKKINPKTTFDVILTVNTNKIIEKTKDFEKEVGNVLEQLNVSMYAFSLVGGIGAKSRNGFGKFRILEKPNILTDYNLEKLLLKFSKTELSHYTALSKFVSILKVQTNVNERRDAFEEVLKLGKAYKFSLSALEGERQFDKRIFISLPRKGANVSTKRHTRTYFFTVVYENEKPTGYIVFLPYHFLSSFLEDSEKKNEIQADYTQTNTEFLALLKSNLDKLNK